MRVNVRSIAGACVLGAGFVIGATIITPPSLMRVAIADDPENVVAAPAGRSHSPSAHGTATPDGSVPAPADVAAAALLPGMDPGSLTQNPDGSLVYHGTTPVGVETPGWSTISSHGFIEMVRGPVAPAPVSAPTAASAPAAADPLQSPTAGPYSAEATAPPQ